MIKIMKYGDVPPEEIFARGNSAADVSGTVSAIIEDVKENGDEALKILDTENIDLIVLVIMMPKINGYELTETLRNMGNEIPIASERRIVIGDVILDYDSLTVTGHGTVQVYKIRFRRLRHHLYSLLVKTVGLCKHRARHSREDNGRKRRRYIGPIIGASIGPDAFAIFGFGKEVTFALGEN